METKVGARESRERIIFFFLFSKLRRLGKIYKSKNQPTAKIRKYVSCICCRKKVCSQTTTGTANEVALKKVKEGKKRINSTEKFAPVYRTRVLANISTSLQQMYAAHIRFRGKNPDNICFLWFISIFLHNWLKKNIRRRKIDACLLHAMRVSIAASQTKIRNSTKLNVENSQRDYISKLVSFRSK